MPPYKNPKAQAFAQLINALCIDNVGRVIARTLAEHFGSIDGLIAATEEELIAIPDIGGIVAQSIIDYFARHADVVERYKQLGINPVHKKQTGGKFDGVKFVLTGTLSEFSRDEARRLIEAEGGIVQSAVSKQTDIVVAGESAGSKLKKAEALGKKIIDETQFKNMLNT